jgi:hypothetical protein
MRELRQENQRLRQRLAALESGERSARSQSGGRNQTARQSEQGRGQRS